MEIPDHVVDSPLALMALLRSIVGIAWLVLAVSAGAQTILTITTTSLPGGLVGGAYSQPLAATGGVIPYSWSVVPRLGNLPPGLSLDGGTGVISGTPSTAGTFAFTVRVADQSQQAPTKSLSINISTPPKLTLVTSSPLPAGMVGISYFQPIAATGGIPPYTFTSSSLAGGWTLSTSGILQGSPTAAGIVSVQVTVTDSAGSQASAAYSITITPQLLITTASPLPPGTAGKSYSQTIAATGGTPPYTFSPTDVLPQGFALSSAGVLSGTPTSVGTLSFSVQVHDALQFYTAQQFQIAIGSAAPTLQASPLALSFSAPAGGSAPAAQAITIFSTSGAPVAFTAQLDSGTTGSSAPAWLTVVPAGGSTPGRLAASVNAGALSAGSYTARIRVLAAGDATQSPIDVAVSLAVASAAPQLAVAPGFLRFAARVQAPGSQEQVLAVQNSGGGGPLSFTASVVGRSSWISVTPGSGQATPGSPALVRVDVSTQGLQVGSYRDVVRIGSAAGSTDVAVSLFVADRGAILGLNVTGVRFQARQGAGVLTPQIVQVLNVGDPALTVNWTASPVTGSDWVSFGAAGSGTATASNPGILTLSASSAAASFPSGGRYALIAISDPNALNSPQYLAAVLDVEPASTPALPDPTPAGLFFTAGAGAAPPQQTVRIYTSSAGLVAFQAGTATNDGASWLAVSPPSGTASTAAPGQVSVSVNAARLAPGVYNGDVNIAMTGAVRTVNVTLVVLPATVAAATSFAGHTAGCTPSRLAITETGLPNNFAAPAGWPAILLLQLNDDCGSPVANGSVVAIFSNGDPPLALASNGAAGTYSATWQPGAASSQVQITVRATAGALQSTTQLVGTVSQNTAPVLNKNGTVNNSYPLGGGALAPGTVAQVYGTGMASATALPGVVPLLNQVNGTLMLIGGVAAPLYYVSNVQLDAQIPFELAPNRQYSAIVSANGALTLPDTINVAPVSPGVSAFADGILIAQHLNYALVDAGHPASPGETLQIYLAGMGPTNPGAASGQPAPSAEPLARVAASPTVTVDGQNAPVVFSGLTPGGVGLYQIDFTVPANARSGTLDVVVTQSGVAANTTKLLVGP